MHDTFENVVFVSWDLLCEKWHTGGRMHEFGPMEGRRHDWTLFVRSELEERLISVLAVEEN